MRNGSCAYPDLWLLVSSFLTDILQERANGIMMENIYKVMKTIIMWIDGFADDTYNLLIFHLQKNM
jgi:hypothetical protein